MISSTTVALTQGEHDLIDDIKDLQYGELFDVELDCSGRPQIYAQLTSQQKTLVDLIRKGVQSFHSIKIHQGNPAYAEVPGITKYGHFKCRKLYKF